MIIKDKLIKGKWNLEQETNVIWNEMTSSIKRVAKKVLGESRGKAHPSKKTWWWNKEVQTAIRAKRFCSKAWQKTRSMKN